ncbi:MAG: 4-hydroxy-tetrahydrodipicolinate reductase [Bdellovibrio sp.]|nr:MAG: 4-hydroxy-tetrahydrodipicolinate reductase [Bdellovibrio sp.]
MSVLRLGLSGSSGRMGKELKELIDAAEKLTLTGEWSASSGPIENLNSAQVIIDFSAPEAFKKVLSFCKDQKIPLVSGTTGLTEKEILSLKDINEIPLLWSPNMSLGIAYLKRIIKEVLPLKEEGFDFQILEVHHRFKKDKPSGTAKDLQNVLQSQQEPLSIRGGGVFGEHTILAMGPEEVLRLEHQALNRRVFARGALKAAQWIVKQPPGYYTMEHVLGL